MYNAFALLFSLQVLNQLPWQTSTLPCEAMAHSPKQLNAVSHNKNMSEKLSVYHLALVIVWPHGPNILDTCHSKVQHCACMYWIFSYLQLNNCIHTNLVPFFSHHKSIRAAFKVAWAHHVQQQATYIKAQHTHPLSDLSVLLVLPADFQMWYHASNCKHFWCCISHFSLILPFECWCDSQD